VGSVGDGCGGGRAGGGFRGLGVGSGGRGRLGGLSVAGCRLPFDHFVYVPLSTTRAREGSP